MVKKKVETFLPLVSLSNSLACNCFGGAVCIIEKPHEAPWQAFRLLVDSLSYFIAAGFLLVTGTVPLFKYMNFHIFTSTGILRVYYELTTHFPDGLIGSLSSTKPVSQKSYVLIMLKPDFFRALISQV